MTNENEKWPSVSVVIPARNAEGTICAALDPILAQDYPGDVEVLVADGSDDVRMQRLIATSYPTVRVVPNPDRITPVGLNRAIEASGGDVIVRCDAHAVMPPGYIRRAVETMQHTGSAVVGGFQAPVGDTAVGRAVGIAMTCPLGAGDSRYKVGGPEGPTDMVYLGVFRRSAIEEVGGFDETLLANEDYELNWRLRDRGETVWLDTGLSVRYLPRRTIGALARQYFNYGRWKSVMLSRNPRSVRWRQLVAPALVCSLAASFLAAAAGIWQLAAVAPSVYLLVLLAGSLLVGLRRGASAAFLLPAVLATMHLSWGVGFFVPGRRPAERVNATRQWRATR